MDIFSYSNYKSFVNEWVKNQPKQGRGKYREIATAIRSSPTIVSQIFKGARELSLEQAADLSKYFHFSEAETEYFLMLVLQDRSGTEALRKIFRAKIARTQKKSQQLKNRLPIDTKVTANVSSTFYSHWYYSGIRNLVAIPEFKSTDSIAEHLRLPRSVVRDTVRFLLEYGLCVEKNGRLDVGPKKTHLGADSPLATRHHINWRLKAFENYPRLSEKEVSYTSPMSLSREDFEKVRRELISLIEKINRMMTDSPSETVACLNIDWFQY